MIFEVSEKAEKAVKKYCDEYEIYIEQTSTLELESKKEELSFAKEELGRGIGIRVIKDGKIGFAHTSDINKIDVTAKQAVLNTKLNKKDKNYEFSEVSKVKKIKGIKDPNFDNISIEEYLEFLINMIHTAGEKCEVTSAGFTATEGNSLVVNSNGVSILDEGTGFVAGISVNAEKNGEIATGFDSDSSRYFNLSGEELSEKVCKLALDSLGAEHIETGDKKVVLDYPAANGLLSTFLSGFASDNVQRGRSILKDEIGNQIVDSNISMYDDSTIESGLLSTKSDSEGVPSQKTTLIENGILKSFVYDIYYGNKGNHESTSNGHRASYSGTPYVNLSNVLIDFKESREIEEIKDGFYVTDVLGAHTANPMSGDFSVEVNNGFKIENGEITKPVKKAMLYGNIYEGLSNAKGIKSEIKQSGNFIIPKILISDLTVIGQW